MLSLDSVWHRVSSLMYLGLVFLFFPHGQIRAETIVSTMTSPGNLAVGRSIVSGEAIAQQFTVQGGEWQVEQITAKLFAAVGVPVPYAQVRADSEGQVGDILPGTLTFSDPVLSSFGDNHIRADGLTLGEGTYWLVVGNSADAPENDLSWGVSIATTFFPPPPKFVGIGVNSGSFGVANDLYAASSDGGLTWPAGPSLNGLDFQRFSIDAIAVPEPNATVLFAAGFFWLALVARPRIF